MNENQPPSFPDLSMNYLSNYAWQEDSSDDQPVEEPWKDRDLQDMLRHQLFGKRDGGDDDPMREEDMYTHAL